MLADSLGYKSKRISELEDLLQTAAAELTVLRGEAKR
jgi:hypothetical protein